jgi:hypothetical protein
MVRAAETRSRSCERRASRPPKYSAEPMDVRRAEGMVPRQRERRGCGEAEMEASAVRRGESGAAVDRVVEDWAA